ncbi:hypothetical protein BD560DRAFT_486559 [Blakeslea trispora]|nr:hypothetical protein BD560DRAFT_486559 [Blakeslea trispora]
MHLNYLTQILNLISVLLSLAGLIIHSCQCALLKEYRIQTGIADWIAAEHWQYLIWYLALSLLLLVSCAAWLHRCYSRNYHSHSFDKRVSLTCLSISSISVITAAALNSPEPWTDGYVQYKRKGSLVSSCSIFDSSKDQTYSLLYQRCVLDDFVLICAILLCLVWIASTSLTVYHSIVDKKDKEIQLACPKKELNWGKYVPDPPSPMYSASTAAQSGLLTPSTVWTKNKHNTFFCENLSLQKPLPPAFDDQIPFSDGYFSKTAPTSKSDLEFQLLHKSPLFTDDEQFFSDKMVPTQEVVESTDAFLNQKTQTLSLLPKEDSLTSALTETPLYTKFSNSRFNSNNSLFLNQY